LDVERAHPVGASMDGVVVRGDHRLLDRTEALRGVTIPTVVTHGEADPPIDVGDGRATTAAVRGAELASSPVWAMTCPCGVRPQPADAVIHSARKTS
jgi:pimeloyl-ACP methyl ester carboxylesterase